MNLHGIVADAIGSVNPIMFGTIMQSNGYTKSADYTQVPAYIPHPDVKMQIQSLQYTDIMKLDGLNVQGVRRAVYLFGNWNGIVRSDKEGGDMLLFPMTPGGPERTWLVAVVSEAWPDWTKVLVTLQDDERV